MDVLVKLENQIEQLLERIRKLQQENGHLRSRLAQEQSARQDVLTKVERLLNKVQEANSDE